MKAWVVIAGALLLVGLTGWGMHSCDRRYMVDKIIRDTVRVAVPVHDTARVELWRTRIVHDSRVEYVVDEATQRRAAELLDSAAARDEEFKRLVLTERIDGPDYTARLICSPFLRSFAGTEVTCYATSTYTAPAAPLAERAWYEFIWDGLAWIGLAAVAAGVLILTLKII